MTANTNIPAGWTGARGAPQCPEGWHTGPPDFVGLGAHRSGTTWWHGALRLHPRIAQAKEARKEWHYFDRFWQGNVPDDFAEEYHRLFPRPPGSLVGEWTPRYMHDFWSIRLLREAAPDARLLVLLRDPVERLLSAVARLLRMEVDGDVRMSSALLTDAVQRGMYSDQLRHVFEVFPREQVMVLQYERCTREPLAEMTATLEFLGLEPLEDERAQRLTKPRPSSGTKPELTAAMRADLVTRYEPDVQRLGELCPEIDISLWANFRHLATSSPATTVRGFFGRRSGRSGTATARGG